MTSKIQLSLTNQKLSDAKDERYSAAVEKYLSALAAQGVGFTSPGPGSPDRWIIHGVQSILFPEEKLPPGYAVKNLGATAKMALQELAAIFRESLAPPIDDDAPSKPKLFIGWDVGAWYCDNNPRSRDAIATISSEGEVVSRVLPNKRAVMWRGNLSKEIHSCKNITQFIERLLLLSSDPSCAQLFNATPSAVLAIDAPLGMPSHFLNLFTNGDHARASLEDFAKFETNPMLFRLTEQILFTKGIEPFSAVQDMIGSQATKVVYALRKFGMAPGIDGVWRTEEFPGISAIETYPSACPDKYKSSNPGWHQDVNDAVTCANVARAFSQSPEAMAMPSKELQYSGLLEREGWIWVPKV